MNSQIETTVVLRRSFFFVWAKEENVSKGRKNFSAAEYEILRRAEEKTPGMANGFKG